MSFASTARPIPAQSPDLFTNDKLDPNLDQLPAISRLFSPLHLRPKLSSVPFPERHHKVQEGFATEEKVISPHPSTAGPLKPLGMLPPPPRPSRASNRAACEGEASAGPSKLNGDRCHCIPESATSEQDLPDSPSCEWTTNNSSAMASTPRAGSPLHQQPTAMPEALSFKLVQQDGATAKGKRRASEEELQAISLDQMSSEGGPSFLTTGAAAHDPSADSIHPTRSNLYKISTQMWGEASPSGLPAELPDVSEGEDKPAAVTSSLRASPKTLEEFPPTLFTERPVGALSMDEWHESRHTRGPDPMEWRCLDSARSQQPADLCQFSDSRSGPSSPSVVSGEEGEGASSSGQVQLGPAWVEPARNLADTHSIRQNDHQLQSSPVGVECGNVSGALCLSGLDEVIKAENGISPPADISRTPSTSTTASSNTGSVETAISSVPSDLESACHECADKSADTLRVFGSIEAKDQTLKTPSDQGHPLESRRLSHGSTSSAVGALSYDQKESQTRLKRYAALLELIETERNYADDLATLVLVFFDNLYLMPFFEDQPGRVQLVMRNAEDLLRLHQKMAAKLEAIMLELGLGPCGEVGSTVGEDKRTDLDKAMSPQADEAIVRIASYLISIAPMMQQYQVFCSRHGEALAVIREAERRHSDWEAFERRCAEILKISRSAMWAASRPSSGTTTPSNQSQSPSPVSYFTPILPLTPANASGTGSTATSASTSVHSLIRQNSSRLLFRDFLIKPIQRLCLYPLVFQTLLKYTSEGAEGYLELKEAVSAMRIVADEVDEAGRKRELEMMAELIVSRVEPHQGITPGFLASLGDCKLAGTLDMLHHHQILDPLVAPLRFRYFSFFLYDSFLLVTKVRKGHTYECRQWFPLWSAKLSNVEDGSTLLPHAFRISVKDHHFELVASNARERQLWIAALSSAISQASFSPPGTEAAFPSSLYMGDAFDTDSPSASTATTPSASRAASEASNYVDGGNVDKKGQVDPLMEFFASHAEAHHANAFAQKSAKAQSNVGWVPTEILLRHASPSQRAAIDRGMIFSEAVLNARNSKDSGDLSSFWPASTASIGASMGTAMGLGRLSGKDTSAVKIQRRKSCAGLLENNACEQDGASLFTATVVHPTSRSRSSTKSQMDFSVDRENWKASLKKKAAKVRPSSIFAAPGPTLSAEEGISPGSMPASPTFGRDFAFDAFNGFTNISPTKAQRKQSIDFHSAITPPSPLIVPGNHPHHVGVTRNRSSVISHGVRDALTASFGRRSRSKSGQTDFTDGSSDFSPSPDVLSPMNSTMALPKTQINEGFENQISSRFEPEIPAPSPRKGSRSSSRSGSIRRALSTTGFKSRGRTRSDVGQLTTLALDTPQSSRNAKHESANGSAISRASADVDRQNKGASRSLGGSLRRSKTMLNAGKAWFSTASSSQAPASTAVERVHAEASASPKRAQVLSSPQKEFQKSSESRHSPPTSSPSRLGSESRSRSGPEAPTKRISLLSLGFGPISGEFKQKRRGSAPAVPRASHVNATSEFSSAENGLVCANAGKKSFSLKFLQNSRPGPAPLRAVAETLNENEEINRKEMRSASGSILRPGLPRRPTTVDGSVKAAADRA
ncbi:hypothetical protein IE53DRAFT_368711 [Violaceomyces palustris]|uniref:Uncharacterized protein n=1 Tax=Violaceomyces palustris TaxID=1673888 RepID=A0ACD0NXX6_9BASI|nr:hypothetical protein IE53DRAFT_368711 [Violaceomyces palustris]